jgi:hypothetical protein
LIDTAEKLAEENKVSERTVKNQSAKFALPNTAEKLSLFCANIGTILRYANIMAVRQKSANLIFITFELVRI